MTKPDFWNFLLYKACDFDNTSGPSSSDYSIRIHCNVVTLRLSSFVPIFISMTNRQYILSVFRIIYVNCGLNILELWKVDEARAIQNAKDWTRNYAMGNNWKTQLPSSHSNIITTKANSDYTTFLKGLKVRRPSQVQAMNVKYIYILHSTKSKASDLNAIHNSFVNSEFV